MYSIQVQSISRTEVQLVGVTAMLLASKYESLRRFAPKVRHLAWFTDQACTPAQIKEMEQVMLRALNFELGRPAPLHFLRKASHAARVSVFT